MYFAQRLASSRYYSICVYRVSNVDVTICAGVLYLQRDNAWLLAALYGRVTLTP